MFLGGGVGLGVAALYGRIFLALVRLVVENGTNGLAGSVVGGSIEQLVGVGGTASRKLVHQVPARRALEEGIDTSTWVTLGTSVHCLEKRRT